MLQDISHANYISLKNPDYNNIIIKLIELIPTMELTNINALYNLLPNFQLND
jgi:hypothetical protein